MTPQGSLLGQDVVHATYGLQRLAHYKSLNSFGSLVGLSHAR
jgi:hypothetical protein